MRRLCVTCPKGTAGFSPRGHGSLLATAVLLPSIMMATSSRAQDPAPKLVDLTAHQAVREGNRRLIVENPAGALEAYQHAETMEPEAREIAFVEGLAHYDLAEFDQAREAFRKAAAFANDALADDALYSLGTCDHAEALNSLDNPQLALSLLENAMGRYHEVLARQPEHAAAHDANFKAASMWQELKRQLQEQPPQQQESCDKDQEQDGSDQEKQDQQPKQSEDEQQQEEKQQSQPSDQEQQQEQEQSESAQQPEDQQQQQQTAAEREEQVSREQAERKLREMMQALRDRKKMRREPVRKIPVTPVDKDW